MELDTKPIVKKKRKADEINLDEELTSILNKNLKLDPILLKNFMDVCKSNNVVMLNQYLKEQNVSPYMTDDEGKTPLIVSIITGSKDAAVTLIKSRKSNFNHLDVYGKNALYYACLTLNLDIIKLLLKIPNINIDIIQNYPNMITNQRIKDLFLKAKEGNLKSLKYSKCNPREVEDNPQKKFRSDLISMFGSCLITGESASECDFVHICNPAKNKLKPYIQFNGLILSNKFYRQYYKKGFIKFNVDDIRDIDDYRIGVKLITQHPEILHFNNKEIIFPIQCKEYFLRTKPKPVIRNKSKKK